jgi:fluoride ion exporter CrcB/FEX
MCSKRFKVYNMTKEEKVISWGVGIIVIITIVLSLIMNFAVAFGVVLGTLLLIFSFCGLYLGFSFMTQENNRYSREDQVVYGLFYWAVALVLGFIGILILLRVIND